MSNNHYDMHDYDEDVDGDEEQQMRTIDAFLFEHTGLSLMHNFDLFFDDVCSIDLIFAVKLIALNSTTLASHDIVSMLWDQYLDLDELKAHNVSRRPIAQFKRPPPTVRHKIMQQQQQQQQVPAKNGSGSAGSLNKMYASVDNCGSQRPQLRNNNRNVQLSSPITSTTMPLSHLYTHEDDDDDAGGHHYAHHQDQDKQ